MTVKAKAPDGGHPGTARQVEDAVRIEIEERGAMVAAKRPGLVLFAAGFRPFFLLAGIQAAVGLAMWMVLYQGWGGLGLTFDPVLWHGHEMVYGFATAALAGFLLTAVPNWTGATYLKGQPVAALTLVWLAGRVAFWLAGMLPPALVAAADLAFLPLLVAVLAPALVAAAKPRNLVFLPVLLLLWAGDGLVHIDLLGWGATGRTGLLLGIYVLLLMISVVGGRIIPAFTDTGLRQRGSAAQARSCRPLEMAAVASTALVGLAEVLWPGSPLIGPLALAAAAIHLVRLAGWRGMEVLHAPLLWVLHAGYLWLVIGLALRGLAAFGVMPANAALHAFTAGAIGTMVMGVMTRAALGHSGRPLRLPAAIVAAYLLVVLSALLRVFLPVLAPGLDSGLSAGLAGIAWMAGWSLYVVVYLPVCVLPRADGRPG